MERKIMKNVAEQIADGLVLEMRQDRPAELNSYVNMVDLLLQQLAEKVVSLLRQANSTADVSDEEWEGRLQKADKKLRKLSLRRSGSEDAGKEQVA
ncbi:MAG: hypothetical protein IH956_07545, partial [Chloroflexi bacterium]|nr:hypothetical protein [Chloroflexota bacterium]